MAEIKFLHCADLHMDMTFATLGTDSEKATVRRQDLKDVFQDIIDLAVREKVDMLLISGDLYEHSYVRKSTINFLNNSFESISPIQVFILPGNHDPFTMNSYYSDYKWSSNVHILTEENPYVFIEDKKVCIYGVGFNNFKETKRLNYNLETFDPKLINILLVHGSIDMNFKDDRYNPMTSENLNSLGMDYIAAGHFHNRINDVGGKSVIYNPGSPEALGFDEAGEHGVYIGSIEKQEEEKPELDIRFLKTGKREYFNLSTDVEGAGTDEQVISKIQKAIAALEEDKALVSVSLTGYTEPGFIINTGKLEAWFRDKVFFLKVKDDTAPDYNFEELKNEPGLRGLFTRKILEMHDKAECDYEKRTLKKALYYGLEALNQGKVEI